MSDLNRREAFPWLSPVLFREKINMKKVIAVDGGLEAAKELGIIPDVIVGDFDTVRPEILVLLPKNGTHHMGSTSAGKKMIQTQSLPLSVLLP